MDPVTLNKSIEDWHSFYKTKRDDLVERLTPALPTPALAAALTGVRRCGKTSIGILMSKELAPDSVLYYNFEDPTFAFEQNPNNLSTLLDNAQQYRSDPIELLILDEIHNIPGWEKWLRMIIDQQRYRCIVTGSSAKLLSSEIATSLTGRCIEYKIWPCSYKEFCRIGLEQLGGADRKMQNSYFRRFLELGGFPEVVKNHKLSKNLLGQYYSDIVLRNVVQRCEIRNARLLSQLAIYYFTNISSLHSYSSLAKAFGTSTEIVSRYTEALKDAFLLFEVERYNRNLKVQARDSRKIYAIDLGLRSSISRSSSADLGKELENVVYLELRRRGLEVMYFKENQEVDFLVLEHYQIISAIQVCISLNSSAKTREREVSALRECLRFTKLGSGIIITLNEDEIIEVEDGTIEVISAWRWFSSY